MTILDAWNASYKKNRLKWRGTTNFDPLLSKGSVVLEEGCGNGKNLSALIGKGLKVYGIDFSEQAISQAKEMVELKGEKVSLSVQDVTKTSFKSDFFDAVFCFHVLGHLVQNDRLKAVQEATRVLKKGGLLFFREFSVNDVRFGKGKEYEVGSFQRKGILTHYFQKNEVLYLFSDFSIKKFGVLKWSVLWAKKTFGREAFECVFIKV